MACGCGGSSKVYKPHEPKAVAQPRSEAVAAQGLPAVWNGPKPKTA